MEQAGRVERICKSLDVIVRRGQQMRCHTAVGVGGEIDCIVYPESYDAAARLVAELDNAGIDWRVLGAGSRLLVGDEPLRKTAVSLKLLEELMRFDSVRVRLPAGYRLSRLATASVERGLRGLTKLQTSTGTVGGALRRQDTAEGRLLKRALEYLLVARDGALVRLRADEVDTTREPLILGCELRLGVGGKSSVKERAQRYLKRWWAVSGPVFLNERGEPASSLLATAGLRGRRVGGAQIAAWNCALIVNDGTATAAQVEELIAVAISDVEQKLGARLKLALERWNGGC